MLSIVRVNVWIVRGGERAALATMSLSHRDTLRWRYMADHACVTTNTCGETLKEFLRNRRAKIRPESVGLPARRTGARAGLRREDVAELLNVSPLWYALFESGTSRRRFSAPFLNRVADTLQLDDADRDLLFRLVTASGAAARDVQPQWNERRMRNFIFEIADTSRLLATSRDTRSAIALACVRLQTLFRSASPAVTLLLQRNEQFESVHYSGPANSGDVVGRRVAIDALACFREVLSRGEVVIHRHIGDNATLTPSLRALGSCGSNTPDYHSRSVMLVPVSATMRPVGVLRVDSPYSNAFTQLEAEVAQTMGMQLGYALFAPKAPQSEDLLTSMLPT